MVFYYYKMPIYHRAAFEKEIEGMPSTRPVTDFPPELHCPLCKEVMKDAVLTSKCCFSSYCDKCKSLGLCIVCLLVKYRL